MTDLCTLPAPKALLFDWDYTLISNWDTILTAMNTALTAFGHDPWTFEESRRRIGASMRDAFPRLFGDKAQDARAVFFEVFKRDHLKTLQPMPGAQAMVEAMGAWPIFAGVVSNKTGSFLRKEADHLGWTGRFGSLIGATDAERDKPDPAPIHLALAPAGLQPGPEIWFVGDSPTDMACAANAGLTAIFVGDHELHAEGLDSWPVHAIFKDCESLHTQLQQLWHQR